MHFRVDALLIALRRRLPLPDTVAVLLLAALPFLFFWRVATGAQVFDNGDISSVFLPFRFELAQALAQGRLPLWSPYLGGGFPLFAEGQVAAVYPPNWILYRFLPLPQALSYTILLHLAWASSGMYLLCRSMRLSIPGALLAGLVFTASGFFLEHLQHVALLSAAAWMPWLVLLEIKFWQSAKDEGGRRAVWFVLSALAIGLQFLCGSPQIEYLNVAVFAFFGLIGPLFLVSDSPSSWRDLASAWLRSLPKAFLLTVGAVLLGAGLAAIQLAPTFELAGFSARTAGQATSFLAEYSLNPGALAVFIAPFWTLGVPSTLNGEFWAYIGLVPLGLAVSALFLRRDRRTIILFGFALVSLSLALGTWNPLYQAFDYVPAINQFRVPARFLLPFLFAAAVLAGIGAEELGRRFERTGILSRLPRRAAAVPVLAIGATMFDLFLFSMPFLSTLDTTQAPADLMASTPSVDSLDASRSSYRIFTDVYNVTLRPNHPTIYGLQSAQNYDPLELQRTDEYLTALSPAMVNLMNIRYLLQPSGPLPEGFAEPTASVVLDLFSHQVDLDPTPVSRVEMTTYIDNGGSLADGYLAGVLTLMSPDGSHSDVPIRFGVETGDWAAGASGAASRPRSAQVLSFPAYLIPTGHSFEGSKYVADYDLPTPFVANKIHAQSFLASGSLTIERVQLIDNGGKAISVASLAGRNDFALVFKSHAVSVLENQDVMPRAFIVHRSEIVGDDQVLGRMREPAFDPARVVYLSDGQALSGGSAAIDRVQITTYQPERVVISAQSDQPGYLVLSDTAYPGWTAQMDGQPAPIQRADHVFRAVFLPPGTHEIVFQFAPMSLQLGAVVSGLTLAVMIGILVLGRTKRKQ